jgi:DNA-binding LacI/PurR family transcriptional regulator
MRKITIQKVAELAGTSVSTVSRVLSNPRYPVADGTRERVLRAVKNSGYQSGPGSRYSRKYTKPDIGVIFPNISNPFYSMACLGIEKEFKNSGYNILMYNSCRDSNKEYFLLKSLQQKRIKSVIISPIISDSDKYRRFTEQGMKLIFLDQKVENMENHILFDYKEGAYKAVKYLYELGHRDFSLASTPLTRWSRAEILSGYQQALNEVGIKFKEEMILSAKNKWENEIEEGLNYEIQSGIMKAQELIKRRSKTTAVICVNDMIALGFIQGLQKNRIKVPVDISVVGFDDIPFAAMFSPALTTIHCPAIEIGQLAAQLIKQQSNGSESLGFDIKLEAHLIVRKSTARI